MIKDPAQAVADVRRMVDEQAIYSTSGKRIPCQVDSICVHGDGPTAVDGVEGGARGAGGRGHQDRAADRSCRASTRCTETRRQDRFAQGSADLRLLADVVVAGADAYLRKTNAHMHQRP